MVEVEVKKDNTEDTNINKSKGRNQIFNYLYVLTIIMVIDDHCGSRIGFFSNIFPYDSFFMPLFVFCSGYFFKKSNILLNIKHKIKKLFVPYLIWNVVFMFLSFIFDKTIGTNWITKPTIGEIARTLIYEPLTTLNLPAWFVIMLFWVSIIYNIIRNIFKENKLNDIVLSISFTILGLISTYLCVKKYSVRSDVWLFFLKISFYIQFFHLGYIFKKYIEKYLIKKSKIVICSICVLINIILIVKYGKYDIIFLDTSNMEKFKTWYLPIVTSLTGIIFYYEIMEFLSRKIGQNSIIDFISRNTFTIMETHLLFINIPNFYMYLQKMVYSSKFINFDSNAFIGSAWYRYDNNSNLIGFFCGLIGSLLVAYMIEKVKNKINQSEVAKNFLNNKSIKVLK